MPVHRKAVLWNESADVWAPLLIKLCLNLLLFQVLNQTLHPLCECAHPAPSHAALMVLRAGQSMTRVRMNCSVQ